MCLLSYILAVRIISSEIIIMGVLKLWELLLTIARPCQIEQLSGKVLAIDASIWIVKIDSLFNSNAEKIKSILSKIMLLKRSNILPIFVFDGLPPALKRKTLEERNRRRLVNNELQAKKRSEIEIMRIIEGDNTRQSQKSHRIKKNEQQLSELNKTMGKLSELRESDISSELLQKISMQSEILNTKYKIMLEITPQFRKWQGYLENSDFNELDIETKIEYLDQMEEYRWKHVKKEWKTDKQKNLSQEDKLKADLQVIQKRSIIRQMQDNLFRKMMQKHTKIEDGCQIIESIYNGHKVIQKRKIKDSSSGSYGFGPLKKGKMKNDAGSFNFNEANQTLSDSDEARDEFVAEFCSNTAPRKATTAPEIPALVTTSDQYSKPSKKVQFMKKRPVKKHEVESDSREQSEQNVQFKKKKPVKKREVESDSREQSEQIYTGLGIGLIKLNQDQPENYVNKTEFDKKIQHYQEEQTDNKDNLPNFTSNAHPEYLNFSNDNLELQNLFTILGVPFIIAPSEAQAQCAALQLEGIVDGVVTEDSDTFLFGGKNVYRGVFQNNIRQYDYAKMQQKLKMNRQKLIIFAMLLGSDYSEGVKGVGLVNAMQILKVFDTFDKVEKFKKWAEHPDVFLPSEATTSELIKSANEEERQFYQLHKKYKNYWQISQSFSNKQIRKAYLEPQVIKLDQLQDLKKGRKFKDSDCKKDLLQKILKQKLQLQQKQYEHFLKLLTLRYKGKDENTLLNYRFKKGDNQQLARIKSKRLQKSIGQDYPQ